MPQPARERILGQEPIRSFRPLSASPPFRLLPVAFAEKWEIAPDSCHNQGIAAQNSRGHRKASEIGADHAYANVQISAAATLEDRS
jgi:hypothetical protein